MLRNQPVPPCLTARILKHALCALLLVGFGQVSGETGRYILRAGELDIAAESSLFTLRGSASRYRGCLWPGTDRRYQGMVVVNMDDLAFNVPWVESVMRGPGQYDTERFPLVSIRFRGLEPRPGTRVVAGHLRLRGHERLVGIQAHVQERNEGVEVSGAMTVRQSDFGVEPFSLGFFKVANPVEIRFTAFFALADALTPGFTAVDLETRELCHSF